MRAAVAEALPAALSAGGTAAALERALGSQLSTALPRAVSDGLGAAFTSQVGAGRRSFPLSCRLRGTAGPSTAVGSLETADGQMRLSVVCGC